MIKKTVFLFIALASCFPALAQIPSTRRECTQRCISMDPANPRKSAFEDKLKSIREKKNQEPDSGKRRELEKEEAQEIEKHQDDLEKMCTTICKNNPEE